jgi:hypothetical protein
MEQQPDPTSIADEAVGQARGTEPPDRAKEEKSAEEAPRRNAPAPAADASISEKSAASVGERSGEAYSDTANSQLATSRTARPRRAGSTSNSVLSTRSARQCIIAGFALGYVSALLLHGHRQGA